MVTLIAIGAIQSFFFSILLFNRRNKSLADKILSLWLLVLGIHITVIYLKYSGYYEVYPHLIGSTSSLIFLYGPFLFFYVDAYITLPVKFKKHYYLHFIPFLLYNIIFIPFYLEAPEMKLQYHHVILKSNPPLIVGIALAVKIIVLPTYLGISLTRLNYHRKNLENFYANIDEVDLNWLRYIIWSAAVIGFAELGLGIMKLKKNFDLPFESEKIIFAAVSVWILALGYYGLKQIPVFTSFSQKETPIPIDENTNKSTAPRYEKTRVKEEEAVKQEEKLIEYMQSEKPFLRTKLSINDLAEDLGIPSHHLSQVINERLNQNFFDFINSYRIEELKVKLKDPRNKHLTMLGIAFDCGFNSKASFNRIFKKHTGQTPSEYLKNDGVEET